MGQQQRCSKIKAFILVAETIGQLKQKSSPKLRRVAEYTFTQQLKLNYIKDVILS